MTKGEFEEKILPLAGNLYRFAFRFLSSREEAEDAVQEIFVKLWEMRDKLSEYKSPEALSITMTRNLCLDRLRRKGKVLSFENPVKETPSDMVNPEHQYVRSENYNSIIDCINALPDNLRIAIQMRDVDGMEYEEISEKLGINLNTLRVNISRGRNLLREQLKYIRNE